MEVQFTCIIFRWAKLRLSTEGTVTSIRLYEIRSCGSIGKSTRAKAASTSSELLVNVRRLVS